MLAVETCIACGARSRVAECPDGCVDVPIDLVDAADVERAAARLEALERRTAALREVVATVAAGADARGPAVAALRMPLPAAPQPDVVQAWGCPICGRVDAPQPCLGVCVRRPVLMTDAAEHAALAGAVAAAEATQAPLAAVAALVAHVVPRPGQEASTATALSARAVAALGGGSPSP